MFGGGHGRSPRASIPGPNACAPRGAANAGDQKVHGAARRYSNRMTPENGCAFKALDVRLRLGKLMSRVGQAALRGPSSTRPYSRWTSPSGVRLGQNLSYGAEAAPKNRCGLALVVSFVNARAVPESGMNIGSPMRSLIKTPFLAKSLHFSALR
jgi:hypothetical protein